MRPEISVVICTHNPREEFLQQVLGSLRVQTLPTDEWELLLVDNGSVTPVARKFDLSWHSHARHLREDELGLTPARLRGIRESDAGILIFVDDDNILAPNYLEQALVVGAQWPFVGTWGGSVIPQYEKPLPAWVGREVWRLTVVEVKEDVWSNCREGFETKPVGAGMCVRRNTGLRFAESCRQRTAGRIMDRVGGVLTGYGDMDICQCAVDIGLGNGRSSKLKLIHLIPASRLTLDYFLRHAEDDAISLVLYRASRGLPIAEPQPISWVQRLRRLLHRWSNRVPREQSEIQKAYERGIEKGWQLARELFSPNISSGPKS